MHKSIKIFSTSLFVGLGLLLFNFADAATLSLSPASLAVNTGEQFKVDVLLDTQNINIVGVDLYHLNFNALLLEVMDADSNKLGVQIMPGSLMPNNVVNNVDNQNGKITFSQVNIANNLYSGSGILASVTFKAKYNGTAQVNFDFSPGKTTDSNVALNGADMLNAVTNGTYTITGGSQPPSVSSGPGQLGSYLRLINQNGTFYVIRNGQKLGVTNPGMLYSYGLEFKDAKSSTADVENLPQGSILQPGDGSLVKSPNDPTVYLISGQKKHGFVSASVFSGLGFKWSSVLVVTAPELQAMPGGEILADVNIRHKSSLNVNDNGTVYFLTDTHRHPYPSLSVWNSWNVDNDFSQVVNANEADKLLPVGEIVSLRVIQ